MGNKLSRKEFLQIWKAVTLAVEEKGIPGHYIRVIPDAGHNANQDNPGFFNRLLLEFLRTHVPA